MPIRRITRAYIRPITATPQTFPAESDSASLIEFLYAIQQHDVCLLPLTSYKALGTVGRGLSGGIEQSKADDATLLAFKEGIPGKLVRDSIQTQDWYSLITEVTVLQHAPILANPHFIDLLGVSFHVPLTPGTEKRAWPLLVTSKVNLGDLKSFLLQDQRAILTSDVRTQLFAEVAEAVYLLHECGIAHGDIKPENILMEQSEEGKLNCKLTDFGSSLIRGLKRLPTINVPWNAPELESISGDLGFDEIAQMDIFSFDLVSIHLLMPLELLENEGLCLIRRAGQTDDEWSSTIYDIKRAKKSENEYGLAMRVLKTVTSSDISDDRRALLQKIVAATLERPCGQRFIPWAEILSDIEKYLSDSFLSDLRTPVDPLSISPRSLTIDHSKHRFFNLTAALSELDDTDYILRANLADDLSVLRKIGFGLYEDLNSQEELLCRSRRTQNDLAEAIEHIGATYQFSSAVPERARNALENGIFVSADRFMEYERSRRMPAARKYLEDEVEARGREFGSDHQCLARLKSELSAVLKAQGHLHEAEVSQRGVIDILVRNLGEHNVATLIAQIELASIIADQGLLNEAVDLYKGVQPNLDSTLGEDHPDTIVTLELLGLALVGMGASTDAEAAFSKFVSRREKFFSPMHPLTINAELCLATAIRLQGQFQRVLIVLERIEKKLCGFFSRDDFTKVHVFIAQAVLWKDLGSIDKASERVTEALKLIDRLQLVEGHQIRVTALEAQASIYDSIGNFEKKEAVLRTALQGALGEQTTHLWDIKIRLAECLLQQNRLESAEAIVNEVLTASERLSAKHVKANICKTNVLVAVLCSQGEYQKALETRRTFLDSCQKHDGLNSYATLQATHDLAELLARQGQYDEARDNCERLLQHYRNTNHHGRDGINALHLITVVCRGLKKFNDAEAYCKEAIIWAMEAFGEDHPQTKILHDSLAIVYQRMRKHSDMKLE